MIVVAVVVVEQAAEMAPIMPKEIGFFREREQLLKIRELPL